MRYNDYWPGYWEGHSPDGPVWEPSPLPERYLDWDGYGPCWGGRPPHHRPPWPPRPPRPPRPCPPDPCDCSCPPPCPPPCPPDPCACPPPCPPPRPRCCSSRRDLYLELPGLEVRQIKYCRVTIAGVRSVLQDCRYCLEVDLLLELEIVDGCGCCRLVTERVTALCCGFPPHILCAEPCVDICGRIQASRHCHGVNIRVPIRVCW